MILKQKSITVLFFLLASIAFGQKNEISLLNNRFYFTFPDSAKDIARPTDIMSAERNANDETRVIFDIGDKRIVFFAHELYLKSVDDLENKLKLESSKEYPFTVASIYNKDSVRCFKITPLKFDDTKNAILANSILIKNADNTLSRFDVYLNPKAFADRKTFDKITEDVFASFRKGNRRLNLNSRSESFSILGTKNVLQLKLPKDYIVTVDNGHDFEVYRVKKITSYIDTVHAAISIYFGFHPSFFNTQFEIQDANLPGTDGEFMLQKMQWLNFRDDQRGFFLREQLFTEDDIEKNAKVHVGMISNDRKLLDELTIIAKELLIRYNK